MKITAFNPLILSPKADSSIKLFEALGFERRHEKTGIGDENVGSVDLKDENGFRVNVAQVDQMPQDMTVIRLSVRDFDEAYNILTAHGFVNARGGDTVTDTGTSKAALMMSPTGFGISLSQHIRAEEE